MMMLIKMIELKIYTPFFCDCLCIALTWMGFVTGYSFPLFSELLFKIHWALLMHEKNSSAIIIIIIIMIMGHLLEMFVFNPNPMVHVSHPFCSGHSSQISARLSNEI